MIANGRANLDGDRVLLRFSQSVVTVGDVFFTQLR